MRGTATGAHRAAPEDATEQVPVSVVIPTRNRPGLLVRSLASVLAQTRPVSEVVVVVDGPDAETEAALATVQDERLRVVVHERPRGAAAARNSGVRASSCPWVAFLDDDDVWHEDKLERQWTKLVSLPPDPEVVIATGVEWCTEQGTRTWPTRAPRPGEPIGEYLFVRDHPGEGFLATPTLLLSRATALAHPMPEHLTAHEDFDWLVELDASGVVFHVVLEPLVRVDGSSGRTSLSRTGTWQASLSWALARRNQLGRRGFSGFCLTEVARALGRPRRPLAAAAVLALATTGRPRGKDVLRYAAIVVVSERWRRRLARLLPDGSDR